MAQGKKDLTPADIELGYERNEIQLKGIMYFGIGLLVLIVITFFLMALFLKVLEDQAKVSHASDNPMQLSDRDRLPVEPRLQGAPGFGVDSRDGRVNLELTAPQAEYWELEKQWKELREKGMKHPETGAVIALSIEEAKQELLKQEIKARTGPDAEKKAMESRRYLTDASSGRMATAERK